VKAYRKRATRVALLAASSLYGFVAAAPALADTAPPPTSAVDSPAIIINNTLNSTTPPPTGSLDTLNILMPDGTHSNGVTIGAATGVNGVGQMTIATSPTSTALLLCTGTLINPRTVIFAGHCVNEQPASSYGVNGTAFGPWANGTPMAFGFGANNLPAVRQWFGLSSGTGPADANPALKFATNINRGLYEVEQVWYDPRSVSATSCTGPNSCFLEGDIAIATLDTPAFGIPTWAMLFSPLTAETHSTITGYGVPGTSASPNGSIDFRRRAAENMISVLGSLNDRNEWLFGTTGVNPQSLYQQDFDSPAGETAYNPAQGRFDFDLFDGPALPREGITAGGDSGGPLIVDQKYSKPVVAGVLSGGTRYFNAQPSATYGTSSFYQPLFLFWDDIVANNPYVYAGNKAGDGNWEDGSHWISLMDPNYMIDQNGVLVNGLPDTPALGVSGNTVKFGKVCFLDDCTDLSEDDEATPLPTGNGTAIYVPGGPGSTNFVPNNVSANPKAGIKAHYYDVTLSAAGTTTLSSNVTVDALTLNGAAKLNVAKTGALNVLGEVNQVVGWTNVDGLLKSSSDMMFATGLLTGSGTLKAPFVTVAAAIVAPGGGDKIGTLTISGDTILASGTSLFIDAQRGKADQLAVTANGSNAGILELSQNDTSGAKPSIVFNKVTDGPAPRAGESYVIATATGGVFGTFGNAYTFQGVLRPDLTYGPNSITATLRAGSLVTILDGQNATAIAFANALDQLRTGFYDKLWNLYGNVDWMNGAQLNATFSALSPVSMVGETQLLQDRQSRQLFSNVSDRLSLLGTGQASGMSFSGMATPLMRGAQDASPQAMLGLSSSSRSIAVPMGGGLSGFVTMSSDSVHSSYGDQRGFNAGQHSRYYATGVEAPFGDVRVGTAVGYAESVSQAGVDSARSKLTQGAAYASVPLGGNAYFGGIVAAEEARSTSNRFGTDTVSNFRLNGGTHSSRYMATAEAGFRSPLGHGLSLNPRAQLGYSRYSLDGFREQGGETALELSSLKVSRLEARFGAKLDGTTHIAGWTVSPQVQADYVRLLSGGDNGLSVRFAAAPDFAFALPLTNGASGWAEVKGGVSMSRGALTLGLTGQATAGDAPISDQRGLVSLSVKF
jgi:hypothetical protein